MRDKSFMPLLGFLFIPFLMSIGSLFAPFGFNQIRVGEDYLPRLSPPSAEHILGTTSGGMDVFSRILLGAPTAMTVAVSSIVLGLAVGVGLGLASAVFGKVLRGPLFVLANAIFTLPAFLIALAISVAVSAAAESYVQIVLTGSLSVAIAYSMKYYRVVETAAEKLVSSQYYIEARLAGISRWRLIGKYLLKDSIRSTPAIISMHGVESILVLAGLSFLGLGIDANMGAEWGYDLGRGLQDLVTGRWWTTLFPLLAIGVSTVPLALISERLTRFNRERLND